MKTVLCFGDSNTWGYPTVPRPDERYGPDERWPGVLRSRLGEGWAVVEEGLSGRTTVHPDPIEGLWLAGSSYLPPCLRTHRPIDVFIVMLGTNDLKMRFSLSPGDIAAGIGVLLDMVRSAEAGPGNSVPRMLVVCPPPILDHHGERPDMVDMFSGGHAKSLRLAPLYEAVAAEYGAAFLDAGRVIETSRFDGIHFDPHAQVALGAAIADAVTALVR